MLDLYSILGVAPTATADDIKAAYRRLARRVHPDANPDSPGAVVLFQDISRAYETLIDSPRRRAYDQDAGRKQSDLRFHMTITSSRRIVRSMPEPQVLYLLIDLAPDPASLKLMPPRTSRVNLTLVLDHSNSMNGVRLDRVKGAAHQIIDHLTQDDMLSLVSFSDRATITIPATPVTDKAALKAKVSMILAGGGTEIFQGLQAGVEQNRRYLAPRLVNHIILLTDGNTYGDEEKCLQLAHEAAKEGIAISPMGLGVEWNDAFLDELASVSGGICRYITSPSVVSKFLNEHVRTLSNLYADRIQLSVAPDPDVRFESAFKLMPSPQPLSIDQGFIPIGGLQVNRDISILLQFELPGKQPTGFRTLARVAATGDILGRQIEKYHAVHDLTLEFNDFPTPEDAPYAIMDALGKLTLYRMQERAHEALENGNIAEATQRLERLATRLIAMGQPQLAEQARSEARRVSQAIGISDEGRKTLKFQTRSLLLGHLNENNNVP